MGFPVAGGVGLATETNGGSDSSLVPVDYFPGMLRDAAQQAWAQYHDDLVALLHGELGKGDLITSGVTLYDLDIRIAGDVALTMDRDDDGDVLVHLTTGGCSITATSTTPTALGSWADPRVEFDFALDLTYRIVLPRATGALSSTGFTEIHVLCPHVDSQNLVADVLQFFNAIQSWFSGVDFVTVLERFIAGTDFASFVNPFLGPLNARLEALAAQGFWFLTGVVDRLDGGGGGVHGLSLPGAPADRLDLMLVARGYDRSGVIEGDITWPSSLGLPMLPGMRDALRAAQMAVANTAIAVVGRVLAAPDKPARTVPVEPAPAGTVFVSLGDEAALNPQPLPPEPDPDPVIHRGFALERVSVGGAALDRVSVGDTALDRVSLGAASLGRVSLGSASLGRPIVLRAALLAAATDAELQATGAELRLGAASRFITAIGTDNFARLAHLFEFGPITFTVQAHVPTPGEPGQFAGNRAVGHMVSIQISDDATTCRRHYVLDQVPIGVPMPVTCALADGWVWSTDTDVACTPNNWDGQVTVRPAIHIEHRVDATVNDATAHGTVFGGTELHDTEFEPTVFRAGKGRAKVISIDQQLTTARQLTDVALASAVQRSVGGLIDATADVTAIGGSQAARAAHPSTPIFDEVTDVIQLDRSAGPISVLLTRHDPTGAGITEGVDFTVTEFTPSVIR